MSRSPAAPPGLTRRGFLASSALAAAGVSATGSTGATSRTDPDASIESFVEERIKESLEEHDVPGATVAVVRDGEITLTAGYGVADSETGRPVEARTPFRVGSVSKPVVATAIARLISRGDLDPDVPVSNYLEDVSRSWEDPVTLAHLVTHTAGFETTNHGMWYTDPGEVEPLPDLLEEFMPAQVRTPGVRGSYSNHGVALAGQAMASIVGTRFPTAIEDLLLGPAGMERSSFRQPLPESMREAHAVGHDASVLEGAYAGLGMAPAGALSTTATDMARFMQLHLRGGVLAGERVLESETIERIQRQWFTHHEELAGTAFGFLEERHGDVRLLSHNGATPGFHSQIVLVPERDFGLFVAFNSGEAGGPREEVPEAILDELLGSPEPDLPSPERPDRASELEGTYRTLRVPRTTHDAFMSTLTATTIDVSLAEDGALLVDLPDETGRWIEVAPLVFQHEETGRKLAFGDEDGEIAFLYIGGAASAFATVEWHESTRVHALLALLAFVGLISGWRHWSPTREASRREWLASIRSDGRRLASLAVHGGSVALLAFLAITVVYFFSAPLAYLSHPTVLYRATFVLPMAGAVASVASVVLGMRAWHRGYWGVRRRVHYGLVATALCGATAFLWYWNLLFPL